MNANTYQEAAGKTDIVIDACDRLSRDGDSCRALTLSYYSLELCSEAGEVAGKIKKIIRDKGGVLTSADVNELTKELGDVCWPLARLCSSLGLSLGDVMSANIDKLASRVERGTLRGDGDNR